MKTKPARRYVEILKNGKEKYKSVHCFKNDDLFCLKDGLKLILMSDLHSATTDIITDLIRKKTIDNNTIVICTGDMAGNWKIGGDADPYDDYTKIRDVAKSLYFVQGNHDIFNEKSKQLKNSDGTFCNVEGILQQTPLGTITGLNGIETDNCRVEHSKHRYSSDLYERRLKYVLKMKPDILLTHQPLGTERLEKYGIVPKYHLCGHYHVDDFFQRHSNHTMINLDSRIIEISE